MNRERLLGNLKHATKQAAFTVSQACPCGRTLTVSAIAPVKVCLCGTTMRLEERGGRYHKRVVIG